MTDARTSDAPRHRGTPLGIVLLAALLVVVGYYALLWPRSAGLSVRSDAALLSVLEQRRALPGAPSVDATALAADPLDPRLVNAVVVGEARRSGNLAAAAPGVALLRRLGWRHSPAVQNIIWQAARDRDVTTIIDGFDGLMRRGELLGPAFTVLDALSAEPALRPVLAERMADDPPWRLNYLLTGGQLTQPAMLDGRYAIMRAVQRSGDGLTRNEIAPILPPLIAAGHADRAFALWHGHRPGVTSPLADADFATAAQQPALGALPIPFEWLLYSGTGFYADTGDDQRGTYAALIWDGRGAPVLASQQTSGRRGDYTLTVAADDARAIAKSLVFKLAGSNGTTTEFVPVRVGAGRLELRTERPVPADFPILQIIGRPDVTEASFPQGSRQFLLRRIDLRRQP